MTDYQTQRNQRLKRLVAHGLVTAREAQRRAAKPEKPGCRADAERRKT